MIYYVSKAFWLIVTPTNALVLDLNAAAIEWIGLVAYRLMGRTDALFPGP
jgi:hypothetical protein